MLSALRLYGNRRPLLRLVSISNRALHPTKRSEFRTNIACRWASLGSILITQQSNSAFVLFLAQARQKRLAGFEGMLDERRCKEYWRLSSNRNLMLISGLSVTSSSEVVTKVILSPLRTLLVAGFSVASFGSTVTDNPALGSHLLP